MSADDPLPMDDPEKKSITYKRRAVLGYGEPSIRITHPRHVIKLMAKTISQVRRGELHYKIAQTVAQLARVALESLSMHVQWEGDELKTINGQNYRVRRIVEVEAVSSADKNDTVSPSCERSGSVEAASTSTVHKTSSEKKG